MHSNNKAQRNMRIIIVGNSGSGKTWLATRLAAAMSAPVVHLDDLFWEPGGFDKKRSCREVDLLIQKSRKETAWIVEGVFGELAQQYLDDAELFVWLDIDWHICKTRLEERGSQSKIHMEREQSEEGLRDLLEWASGYYHREDLRSHKGHESLFEMFRRDKIRLTSESDVGSFMEKTYQIEQNAMEQS